MFSLPHPKGVAMNTLLKGIAYIAFWTALALVFVNPIGAGVAFGVFELVGSKVKQSPTVKAPETKPEPWPCPRCANTPVELYDRATWSYFTCRKCGARGRYPFLTLEERRRRILV